MRFYELFSEPEFVVEDETLLSNPEALMLISKVAKRIQEKEGSLNFILLRTLEYLKKFSKVDPERVAELRSKLEKHGLKQESIIMLINICPQTVDEARLLLELEERVLDTELVEEIVNTLKQFCREK